MLQRWLLLLLFFTACHNQYMDGGLRADVTFNEDNDRYDVGNIINEQSRLFHDLPVPMDYDARRSLAGELPLVEVLKQDRRRLHQSRNQKSRRMSLSYGPAEEFDEIDYNDRMEDKHDELGEYNRNLENFRRLKPPAEEVVSLRRNHENMRRKQHDILKHTRNCKGKGMKNGLRRMTETNPEGELLLHYAVPLKMKVKGYIEIPKE